MEGENATNRTSFLQAIVAAIGTDQYTLKSNVDAGRVGPTICDTAVARRSERRSGTVTALEDGDLDDPELADLFAFLLGYFADHADYLVAALLSEGGVAIEVERDTIRER
ncbi:hypothetical protein [Halorubellus salinus]|uniref:hypothetical protein n=1 Tax=Halorubellus salinus TaxID=755309 RepID=UPI001D07EA07|nr:hypothetical protein [Halorubellus salinus]